MEMMTFVFYDIENDRIRGKIADACLDYGLRRLQFSVFCGALSRNRREEVFVRLTDLLGRRAGCIIMQAVCDKDLASQKLREILPGADRDDTPADELEDRVEG